MRLDIGFEPLPANDAELHAWQEQCARVTLELWVWALDRNIPVIVNYGALSCPWPRHWC